MGHRRPPAPPHLDSRGATVVELMVVVGLVVLLVVIALTSVTGIHDRQRTSACKAELAKVQTAVEAYRALPRSQNPDASPPASLAALKFTGLLDGGVGRYVAYGRVRTNGHWEPRYANGPKGNCVRN